MKWPFQKKKRRPSGDADAATRAMWACGLAPGARVLHAGAGGHTLGAARSMGYEIVELGPERPPPESFDAILVGGEAPLSLGACRALLKPGGAVAFVSPVRGKNGAAGAPAAMEINAQLAAAGLSPVYVEVADAGAHGFFVARLPGGPGPASFFGGADGEAEEE